MGEGQTPLPGLLAPLPGRGGPHRHKFPETERANDWFISSQKLYFTTVYIYVYFRCFYNLRARHSLIALGHNEMAVCVLSVPPSGEVEWAVDLEAHTLLGQGRRGAEDQPAQPHPTALPSGQLEDPASPELLRDCWWLCVPMAGSGPSLRLGPARS